MLTGEEVSLDAGEADPRLYSIPYPWPGVSRSDNIAWVGGQVGFDVGTKRYVIVRKTSPRRVVGLSKLCMSSWVIVYLFIPTEKPVRNHYSVIHSQISHCPWLSHLRLLYCSIPSRSESLSAIYHASSRESYY